MKQIEKIVELNAYILDIPVPRIEIKKSSFFKTKTTKVAIVGSLENIQNSTLCINEDFLLFLKNNEFECWLAISHEMRHLWQIVNGKSLQGYQTSDRISLASYNEQELEIDAWAWATVAVVQNVGKLPDYKQALGESLHKAIFDRAEEILCELKEND